MGTSHLNEHTKNYAERNCLDIHQTRLFRSPCMPRDSTETLTLALYELHQDKGKRDWEDMIILHEYPFCMAEHYGFRKYLRQYSQDLKFLAVTQPSKIP